MGGVGWLAMMTQVFSISFVVPFQPSQVFLHTEASDPDHHRDFICNKYTKHLKAPQRMDGWKTTFKFLGGGNSNIFWFHPNLGKVPILINTFQMGWNHQPDLERPNFPYLYTPSNLKEAPERRAWTWFFFSKLHSFQVRTVSFREVYTWEKTTNRNTSH